MIRTESATPEMVIGSRTTLSVAIRFSTSTTTQLYTNATYKSTVKRIHKISPYNPTARVILTGFKSVSIVNSTVNSLRLTLSMTHTCGIITGGTTSLPIAMRSRIISPTLDKCSRLHLSRSSLQRSQHPSSRQEQSDQSPRKRSHSRLQSRKQSLRPSKRDNLHQNKDQPRRPRRNQPRHPSRGQPHHPSRDLSHHPSRDLSRRPSRDRLRHPSRGLNRQRKGLNRQRKGLSLQRRIVVQPPNRKSSSEERETSPFSFLKATQLHPNRSSLLQADQ